MTLFSNHQRKSPGRLIPFSISSLLFHAVLFLLFAWMDLTFTADKKPDEEVITMVELESIPPSPQKPAPTPLKGKISTESALSQSGEGSEETQPSEPALAEKLPVLDPELDEEIESPFGENGEPALSDNGPALPMEAAETNTPPSREADMPSQEVSPEETPLMENNQEQIADAAPLPSETEDAPVTPSETKEAPPERLPGPDSPPEAPVRPSAAEPAEPSEIQEPHPPANKNIKLAANTPPKTEHKIRPKPAPPKPSKEKVKKSGLLGLLGDQKGIHKTSLSPKNKMTALKNKREKTSRNTTASSVDRTNQKMAQIRQNLLSGEKTRLKRRQSGQKRHHSQIKIVHGSGRNYGIISSAIEQKRGRLTTVYNEQLLKNPKLQGNLIVEFTISPEGTVTQSQVLTSSFSDPRFEKALIQAIRRWKFPTVKQGETTVLYPLSFFPTS